ncbi:hypothetical protein POSPLADRAFT_1061484 [Postia placenta MAD-698-R-SB12]|uniref:DNA binding protein Ncp1 n=1 Tax=Postia placenta MAD-698-R-SB12 TaxID=670580 RepID=A0A1X6MNB1_9APHY|nr:hypothetical protein POSPLADRAFT_1061484 [Postia placenta MAD-698-R-SB12]OSX57808.1 hypothetical protein POSPLADRAFT_1061484 [Postia placenta MAD-698-R-SB12]
MSITFDSQPAIQSSPASEHSVYFDAPLMHFFTKKKDSSDDLVTGNASTQDSVGSVRQQDKPQDSGEEESNLIRKRSVTIPADPVVAESRDYATEEVPDGQRAAPIQKTSRGTSMSPPPDSGYGSSPPSAVRADDAPRSPSRNTRRSANIEAVPVVWSDNSERPQRAAGSEDDDDNLPAGQSFGSNARRVSSMRSVRSSADRETTRTRDRDQASIRSRPASRFSERRRRISLSGGSFAAGAGTIGPGSTLRPEDTASFHARSKSVDAELTPKQRSRIQKVNTKDGKRVAKVIKAEAKAEKAAIEQAIRELADVQRMQRQAIKEESKTVSTHAKALRQFHKDELEYLAARAKYERAQAELQTWEDMRDSARQHAAEVTDRLQEKNQEVEWLRAQKAADDREREAKLKVLTGRS